MFEDNHDEFESNSMKDLESMSKVQVLHISITHPVGKVQEREKCKMTREP